MIHALRVAALLLFFATTAPLAAQDGEAAADRRSFTCPLGGERFTQEVGYPSFPLITLPDGSWLGDPAMDVQIPVCPGNGLVILPDYAAMGEQDAMAYGAYDAAELARLPALIADPAYRALAADNRHAQAWWLATQLGRPASLRFHLLQRSTWATVDPDLRRRRVAAFAADAPALIAAMDEPAAAKQAALFHVVNALRELGRFDEALAWLDTIEADGPVAGLTVPDDLLDAAARGEPMRAVIAARDDDRYPVELLDRRLANDKCSGALQYPPYDQRTPKTEAACARRQATQAAAEATEAETLALLDDPARLDPLCTATPDGKRRAALAGACDARQSERDRIAGAALAMKGAALAPQCEATPEDRRKGALFHACLSYDIAVESALGAMLAADDAAYQILCDGDGGREIMERDRHVSAACYTAHDARQDAAVAALEADPHALAARCTGTPEDTRGAALEIACNRRDHDAMTARIALLARDDGEYRRQCARFGGKPRDLFADDAGDDEIACDQARYRRAGPDEAPPDGEVIDVADGEAVTAGALEAARAAAAVAGLEQPGQAAIAEMDSMAYFDEGSELRVAATAAAATIVARAKSEGTYPRRQPGDLY